MCLRIYIESKKQGIHFKQNPLIASKDITVWKVLEKNDRSVFRKFKYQKGVHYFQTGKPFSFRISENVSGFAFMTIDKGLHSYCSRTKAKSYLDTNKKIVKFIIPKGSKYYLGCMQDIVSDQLIYPY